MNSDSKPKHIRSSQQSSKYYDDLRRTRLRTYTKDLESITSILSKYLHGTIDGTSLYRYVITLFDVNAGLRNEFLDVYMGFEAYAANEMRNKGHLFTNDDIKLTRFVCVFLSDLTDILIDNTGRI